MGNEADAEISAFGLTNFRGITQQFGMLRGDRGRHVYIIGQTGTGKSGLLELFALSDIFHNHGYAIIDPHGDFAINNLRFVPPSRVKDVVYFNPADTAFPIGFNPMEVINPEMKNNISSEVVGVLKRMFGETSWGPRLEYILRYTILALLDYPNTTLLDIAPMLTDKKFRKKVVEACKDTVVRQFWNVEFASWTEKFAAEAIAPVLNKVGAFTANPIIRNIVGQPKSTFNIRQIMDEGKILVVNLSKGLIGEDNAGILGSFIVTKVQLAAMSRSDIPHIEDRRPFYLYVDEFQNFATDSFATILSEARKYGLNLTVANQYVSQMQQTVRDAVFGNVGTMISFRISPDDAPLLGKQFAPQFLPEDIMQMHNRHFITSMVINGEKAPAFSATTLTLPPAQTDFSPQIIENTRRNYAKPRAVVEAEINELINPNSLQNQQLSQQPAQQPQSQAQQKQHPIPASSLPVQTKPVDRPAVSPVNQQKATHDIAAAATTGVAPEVAPRPTQAQSVQAAQSPQPPSQPAQPAAEGQQGGSGKKRRRRRRSKGGQGGGESSGGQQGSQPANRPTVIPAPQPTVPQQLPPKQNSEPGETVIRLR
jgi:hypothetical protein